MTFLSEEALILLTKYPHYFVFPFATRDASASCATNQFLGAILSIIGLFKGLWYGIFLGILNWCIMGYFACSYTPTALIHHHPVLAPFHDEAMKFIIDYNRKNEK